jgi:hypothetical protein
MDELSSRATSYLLAAILYADEARSQNCGQHSLIDQIAQGLTSAQESENGPADLPGAIDAGRRAAAEEVLAWLLRQRDL